MSFIGELFQYSPNDIEEIEGIYLTNINKGVGLSPSPYQHRATRDFIVSIKFWQNIKSMKLPIQSLCNNYTCQAYISMNLNWSSDANQVI